MESSDIFLEGDQTNANQYAPKMSNLVTRIPLEELQKQEVLDKINAYPVPKVFLIGYPSELGTRNLDGRAGVEKGPESFREIMQLTQHPSDPASQTGGSYAQLVRIFDVGDIAIYEGSSSEFMARSKGVGSQASELRDRIMVEAGKRL